MSSKIEINVEQLYTDQAKIPELKSYIKKIRELAGEGNEIVLTGRAPIWLYLKIAHELHGKALRLLYSAPNQGIEEFEIFNHNPF